MMFRFILLAAIIYVLVKWLRHGGRPPERKKPPFFEQSRDVEEMVQDPVCGTYLPAGQALTLGRENETFYFCSDECREKFKQIPRQC